LKWGRDVPYSWEVHNGAIFRNFSLNIPKGSELVLVKFVSLYNSHATYGELVDNVLKNLQAARCYCTSE
jgi:hypothetical protein